MLSKVSESSTSARWKEAQQEALSSSLAPVVPLRTSAKEPPPYGAQHRQDALWEGEKPRRSDIQWLTDCEAGGNEALPPLWHQFEVLDETQYQDDKLTMVTRNRPLPGVRLDGPGDLVASRYEWHISPLGRSYFVNHNTRTTSWKKPKPERHAESLIPECVIEGHSACIWSLAYLGTSGNIMSTSEDSSIRQWKRNGEPVGKPWYSDKGIGPITVSPDETMVIGGIVDGSLQLWNIKEGGTIGDPLEGHKDVVRCLDWSHDALEVVSGSEDGTIRRWNPNTGRQIAPPMETSHGWVLAVKYSPQGDKFTSSGADGVICVWLRNGKLLIKIKGHDKWVASLCWSKDGTHIYSASSDHTIRKWRLTDGQELVVFRGHTNSVKSLCLTPDESYIVSASSDCSIRIWDLKTNQVVGDPLLHDDRVVAIAMSPDEKYIASAGPDKKIYVWNLEAALEVVGAHDDNAKLDGCPTQPRVMRPPIQAKNGLARYGNDFFGNESDHAPRHAAPPASPSFLSHWRRLLSFIHFSTRPADASKPIERQSRHWNFNFKLFSGGNTSRTVDVALAQDENRIAIVPETDAEAAAAMQRTDANEADNSLQPGQLAGAQAPQVQPIQTQAQGPTGGVEDFAYEGVSCCGFFFGRRRSTLRQS